MYDVSGTGTMQSATRATTHAFVTLFTGKERDTESGNDYFGARYYTSAMGRFMSPDWSANVEPVPYAKLYDPQTLNLYSYVGNNPLARADADGHCFEDGCAVETAVGLGIVACGAVEGLHAYYSTPAAQRANEALSTAISQGISSTAQSVKNTVSGWFSKKAPDPGKPGTRGKPDHQATAAEEADKIGGKTEVRIPTPGGAKETRVGDAVATDANGKPTAVTQVIRPTPAGNVPLREKKAAQDIENATGVKPKLVPVRPLPQK
jgi:RHS repeat-associated protein